MLSIEASCVRSLDLEDVIKAFVCQKTRSKPFCYYSNVTSNQWRTRRGGGGRVSSPFAWKIQGKLCFQGKLKLVKNCEIANSECKKYIFNTVNSGHTLFFRAGKSCSKILNVKSILHTVKNFMTKSVFRANAKFHKNPERQKIFQRSEKFQGKLCFSGQRMLFKILND